MSEPDCSQQAYAEAQYDHDYRKLEADNERLRGLLREALPHIYIPDDCDRTDEIRDKIDAALAGAAVQPSALPERCSVCGGAHDVGNPCRATSPTDGAP